LRVHDEFALSWTHVEGVAHFISLSSVVSCALCYRTRGDRMEVTQDPKANSEFFMKKPECNWQCML
jgi:hypothetical protein